jgi:hypothetical protein
MHEPMNEPNGSVKAPIRISASNRAHGSGHKDGV